VTAPQPLRRQRQSGTPELIDASMIRAPRLHVASALAAGETAALTSDQANYLGSVLRLKAGDRALAFNGRDGEFSATIVAASRKALALALIERTRPPQARPDLDLLFAPLKHARLDYMAQKAVEMGAGRLRPIVTRRTQVARLNLDRLEANGIEAAEQCGAVWTPEVCPLEPLEAALAGWPADRLLVFCDEDAPATGPLKALAGAAGVEGAGLLIGPEGGFDEGERAAILKVPRVLRLSLGPRILRADTAAVAALALLQATIGDWRRLAKSSGD
jgi:16S rRNA (uracil1498-N3)-methyltransferase